MSQRSNIVLDNVSFIKGENICQHLHSLALKVLGSRLGSLGRDPIVWVESLFTDDKLNQSTSTEGASNILHPPKRL
jgi:hypothetical protein